jgi:hypothetical protein
MEAIMRNEEKEGEPSQLKIYTYPFFTLPPLKSHLHPKFAIFDAGRKLKISRYNHSSSEAKSLQKVGEHYPSLAKVLSLYNTWVEPIPNRAMEDESYNDPRVVLVSEDGENFEDGDYDGRTNRTESGRGDGLRPRTRSVVAAERDGDYGLGSRPRTRSVTAAERGKSSRGGARTGKPAAVKKRKVHSESSPHNKHLLSEATLSRFNRQSGDAAWTSDRIRQWSKTFPGKRKILTFF